MADKYKHLAPRRDRDCHRADGQPKRRFTESEAEETAARFPGYHAYECPACGWWHTGRPPKPDGPRHIGDVLGEWADRNMPNGRAQ